jgi:hypothetical protein
LITKKRKTTMTSKDDNKHNYAADDAEQEVEEAPP